MAYYWNKVLTEVSNQQDPDQTVSFTRVNEPDYKPLSRLLKLNQTRKKIKNRT